MNTHHRHRTIPADDQLAKDLESIRAVEEICLYPIEFVATIKQDEDGLYLAGYQAYAGGDCLVSEIEGMGKHRHEIADELRTHILEDPYHWLLRPEFVSEIVDIIDAPIYQYFGGPL